MCHPVQAHIEHTHIRRHRHAPSAHLPPTLLGLCPAGDAQCHMCSVWRHKWRQIALTLILIPIPNRIRIRILAHHILSFNLLLGCLLLLFLNAERKAIFQQYVERIRILFTLEMENMLCNATSHIRTKVGGGNQAVGMKAKGRDRARKLSTYLSLICLH